MHTVEMLERLKGLAEDAGYTVRHEWLGGVAGGACMFAGIQPESYFRMPTRTRKAVPPRFVSPNASDALGNSPRASMTARATKGRNDKPAARRTASTAW